MDWDEMRGPFEYVFVSYLLHDASQTVVDVMLSAEIGKLVYGRRWSIQMSCLSSVCAISRM